MVVHDLSDEERIAAIRVALTPVSAGAPLVRELPTPAPGQPWSGILSAIPAGSYTATAQAFDAADEPLFESASSAPFVVQAGNTPQVNLFLFQRPVDPPFVAPYLVAINFMAEPKEGQSVTIVVRGAGGEGVLELSGNGDGVFASSTGDAKAPAGASIQWTPGGSGPRNIVLYLEDEAGNRAAHALTVVVPAPVGAIQFSVSFNHAPYATTVATSTTTATSTQVELRTTFHDDANGQLDYAWDFSACGAVGLAFDPGGDSATGAVPRNGERTFGLQAADGQARTCVAHLELRDRGAGPAVQRQTLAIRTEFMQADCEPGLSACFGVCTDTQTDREHCGACYNICGLGERCEEGSCEQVCAGGLAYCDGDCVDLDADPDFCGDCQTACRSDQICSNGACACPGGWLTCDSVCTDVSTSTTHCGACNNTCTGGMTCDGGSCACPSPLSDCSGICVDQSSDNQNCGACGSTCPAGQHCDGGGCACDTPGLTACGALCIDTQTNDNYCGNCATSCGAGETCQSGSCAPAGCPPGQDACGPGGACVDITENASHCGGCNKPCNTYDPCVNGICMPDPEWANWPVPPYSPSAYTYPQTGVVLDGVTKLMWQRSVPASSYTWQGAIDYCKDLILAGFSDWRLPTRLELISIVNEGTGRPAINATAFPSTPSGNTWFGGGVVPFWSSTTVAANPNLAWYVDYEWGFSTADRAKTSTGRVRCVRYGPGYPKASDLPARFTVVSTGQSGYVRDNITGLRWQHTPRFLGTPTQIQNSCQANYSYDGAQAGLPLRKDLETIVDVRRAPALDTAVFAPSPNGATEIWTGATHDATYWQSSFIYRWLVDFEHGVGDADSQTRSYPGRCMARRPAWTPP